MLLAGWKQQLTPCVLRTQPPCCKSEVSITPGSRYLRSYRHASAHLLHQGLHASVRGSGGHAQQRRITVPASLPAAVSEGTNAVLASVSSSATGAASGVSLFP
eukprot:scaffold61154_cov19-Tisochrysis_lutea.AAC.3